MWPPNPKTMKFDKIGNYYQICDVDVSEEEILFISDIEDFVPRANNMLMEQIINDKKRVVVFIGDILSFLEIDEGYFKIYKYASFAWDLLVNEQELIEKNIISEENLDDPHFKKKYMAFIISKRILENEADAISNFCRFIEQCKKLNVKVIYYSGNHDSMLSPKNANPHSNELEACEVIKMIYSLENLFIFPNMARIKMNDNLFLMGVHTSNNTYTCNEYPSLHEYINELDKINKPENIIFLSHVPGVEKYSKIGSKDITNLKKRYKFKSHYHGHCKDYHGTYIECGVKTRSVHACHTKLFNLD